MKKINFLMLLSLAVFFSFSCTSVSKFQQELNHKVAEEAFKSGEPVFIKCGWFNQNGVYTVTSYSASDGIINIKKIGSNETDSSMLWRIENIYFVKKEFMTDWTIKYSKGSYTLKGSIAEVTKNLIKIKPFYKTDLTLIDNSVMTGLISGFYPASGDIIFTTKFKNYTLSGDKILKLSDSGSEVKVILLDGSQRLGLLTQDDGDKVTIKTILGIESFNRKDILKIDYKNNPPAK